VLSSFDDYPIHQASVPVAHTADGDLNRYDRYFFNGYTTDASVFFAVAMGLYPNRHVADASFSVMLDGAEQISLHTSRRAPLDRAHANVVGPIVVQVVEPLAVLRITVDAPEHGLRGDLTFHRRSAALEEPHFFHRVGQRVMMDSTRMTQFGRWTGWLEVRGQRHDFSPSSTWGSRDRSWGVRGVGERSSTGAPLGAPQFFWLWSPISFADQTVHADVNELPDGRRWHEVGFVAPDDGEAELMRHVHYDLVWQPGTRRVQRVRLRLGSWSGQERVIDLEPLAHFQMLGLGYGHPDWGHGMWKGELEIGVEHWLLPVEDPLAVTNLHVQTLCRATGDLGEGLGVVEQLVIGPHHPSGLSGLLDAAPQV
jgi:hypothetical protein